MTHPLDEYRTMRHLGEPHGLTSHDVGLILRAEGLRSCGGQPTTEAHELGLVKPYSLAHGRRAWKWHTAFVTGLLVEWKEEMSLTQDDPRQNGAS